MKLLVYIDAKPASLKALDVAADLVRQLQAELALITIRSGTHAIDPLPPYGRDITLGNRPHLPPGIQALAGAVDVLTKKNVIRCQETIRVQELPNGHMFACQTPRGKRIPFHVHFGHGIEILNREIRRHHYDQLVIAPPIPGMLRKMIPGGGLRKLVLDVHSSVFVVRRALSESRFVVCVDGSTSNRRLFPMLKRLIPVATRPLDLVWVRTPNTDKASVNSAHHYLERMEQWLTSCGKPFNIHRLEGKRPEQLISELAGDDSLILLSASLRHDVYRRLLGSLPTRLLPRTASSLLVVKGLPEHDPELLAEMDTCYHP